MAPSPDKLKQGRSLNRSAMLLAIARVPGSERAFVGASDFKVYDVNLAAAKDNFKELGAHESYVTGVALAGKHLVSGGYDGRLVWWDIDSRKKVRAVDAHKKWIRRVVATPDGKQVISVGDDMVARVWDAASGKQVHELKGHAEKTPTHFPSMLFAATVTADGKLLATGDKTGKVIIWDLATGKQVGGVESPGMYTWDPVQRVHSIGGIRSLAFSGDGSQLAVGGIGKIGNIDHLEGKARVEVFDWKQSKQTFLHESDRFKGLVNFLAFHPDGAWLVGAGGANEGFLIFLDVKAKKATRQEKTPMFVHDAVLNEKRDTIYLAGHHRLVQYTMKG
jgi:WD40 repeat protein